MGLFAKKMAESRELFSQDAPSWMLARVLDTPMKKGTYT